MNEVRKVDLNTASVQELKAVKGIGEGRAEQIVLYRNAHGPFRDMDQLGQVPHVGNMPVAELNEIKEHLAIRTLGENKPRVEP